MKIRTHYHITKLAIELYLKENYLNDDNIDFDIIDLNKKESDIKKDILKKEKLDLYKITINQNLNKNILSIKEKLYIEILCIGSMLPDLMPSQFIHHHFYQKSKIYIFKKIEKLIKEEKASFFNIIALGKISHYLSDFCCFAHRNESIKNPREHILYERELNRFMLKNMEEIRNRVLQSSNFEKEAMSKAKNSGYEIAGKEKNLQEKIINKEENYECKLYRKVCSEDNMSDKNNSYESEYRERKTGNINSAEVTRWISDVHRYYLTTDKSYENDLLLSVVLVKGILEKMNMTKRIISNNSLICTQFLEDT